MATKHAPAAKPASPGPAQDKRPAIVWLRQDLRLADNPALAAAVKSGRPLLILYVLDDETPGKWRMGGASRWWLHKSLEALQKDIVKRGGRLILRRGRADKVIARLAEETSAAALYWCRLYDPASIARDKALKASLAAAGITVESFNGALLHEPWEVATGAGGPFKVFTPYWRAARALPVGVGAPTPKALPAFSAPIASDALADWALPPTRPNWAARFETAWRPGEAGAHAALQHFLDEALQAYPDARNRPNKSGTSRLSPHLHFGEISPRQILAASERAGPSAALDKFHAELGWREFSAHLLFHWPELPETNWKPAFDDFPWVKNEAGFRAWTKGQTGYPIVDAGMRELWTTGWMHNRVRMIAASFLIKDLLIDWRRGQDWFWDTLVDADLANNAASWQWVAGSGADASPYFRIFNPTKQGETYDPDGAYIRQWVPELARLPDAFMHRPHEADPAILRAAGVKVGETYPLPIVDHAVARTRALDAYAAIKASA
ncbi:MAG: deoxyribodipyrimidine photo-lyase [Hyphomonadaceae bacterium]